MLPQLIGTSTVTDTSAGVDENGCPVTSKTLQDLEAPGTKFGTMTIKEWEQTILDRYPEVEIVNFNSMANLYTALDAGQIDAAIGFLDERQTLAGTHPDIALIEEPYAKLDFGFGTQKTEKGKALCEELNTYLAGIKANGEYDKLREKWEDPARDKDVMGTYSFTGEKGTLRVVTGGLWTPMSFYIGETLTGEFIEIINGFCAQAGYTPEFETVAFSAELTGLASGNNDISAEAVTYSEERLDSINITDPLMSDDYYLYVRTEPAQKEVAKASSFIQRLRDSIRLSVK